MRRTVAPGVIGRRREPTAHPRRLCGVHRWFILALAVVVVLAAACGGGGQAQPATTDAENGGLHVTAQTVLRGGRTPFVPIRNWAFGRLLRFAPRPDGAHRCRRAPDQPPPRRPLRAAPSRHHRRPGLHLTGGGSRFGWPYEPAVSLGHLDTARGDPGRRTLRVGARVAPRPRVLWARHDNQWRCLSARWPSSGPVAAGSSGRAGRRRPALPGRAGRSAPAAGGGIGWVGGGSSGRRHLSRRTRVICSFPTLS